MNDRPHAAELLKTARAALSVELLPALPEALRYTGLMIANAIAIAERELMAGDAAARAECGRLRRLLPECSAPVGAEEHSAVLARYNRRLADDIRAGRFDGEHRSALLEHLRLTTGEKLAVSNPKALHGP
jgi:uncharacterized protein DUF6285